MAQERSVVSDTVAELLSGPGFPYPLVAAAAGEPGLPQPGPPRRLLGWEGPSKQPHPPSSFSPSGRLRHHRSLRKPLVKSPFPRGPPQPGRCYAGKFSVRDSGGHGSWDSSVGRRHRVVTRVQGPRHGQEGPLSPGCAPWPCSCPRDSPSSGRSGHSQIVAFRRADPSFLSTQDRAPGRVSGPVV